MPLFYAVKLTVPFGLFLPVPNRDAILRAKRLLENVQAQVLGAVLNSVDISGAYGSSHYYYYYHSSSSLLIPYRYFLNPFKTRNQD
jgi:hypothetical protein